MTLETTKHTNTQHNASKKRKRRSIEKGNTEPINQPEDWRKERTYYLRKVLSNPSTSPQKTRSKECDHNHAQTSDQFRALDSKTNMTRILNSEEGKKQK